MENEEAFCFTKSDWVEIDLDGRCWTSFYFDWVYLTIKLTDWLEIFSVLRQYVTILCSFALSVYKFRFSELLIQGDWKSCDLAFFKGVLD